MYILHIYIYRFYVPANKSCPSKCWDLILVLSVRYRQRIIFSFKFPMILYGLVMNGLRTKGLCMNKINLEQGISISCYYMIKSIKSIAKRLF